MQIPILNGVYTDDTLEYRVSYPQNMIPVIKSTGVSTGYLKPAPGILQLGAGPGVDRGGIAWKGECYRVMGTSLVKILADGTTTTIGDVGGSGQVTLDYSFDRLCIASANLLYYYNGTSLTIVGDPDLGAVIDVVWIAGYFLTTDGTSLVVTELSDPTSVNPLKYGSSESDPDNIVGVCKIKNELYAINRYTIEVFENVGGDLFPFSRIEGAQVSKGAIGTHAKCVIDGGLVFIGSGRGGPPSVYVASNGSANKIASRDIDILLQSYTESQLSLAVVEAVQDKDQTFIYCHLPDRTMVFDFTSSSASEEKVWFTLSSSILGVSTYRARNFVWCYDKMLSADPTTTSHGYFSNTVTTHYSSPIEWGFSTPIIYNQARGAIINELELVSLPGQYAIGATPIIWTSYSLDGRNWSQLKAVSAGTIGNRLKRIRWMQQGHLKNTRIQKFRGTSDCPITISALEARIEQLNV